MILRRGEYTIVVGMVSANALSHVGVTERGEVGLVGLMGLMGLMGLVGLVEPVCLAGMTRARDDVISIPLFSP